MMCPILDQNQGLAKVAKVVRVHNSSYVYLSAKGAEEVYIALGQTHS